MAAVKALRDLVDGVEAAVGLYEEPPDTGVLVQTPWDDVWLEPEAWAEAYAAQDAGVPHNEARAEVWKALLDVAVARHGSGDPDDVRRAVALDTDLRTAFHRAWPILRPEEILTDLYTVPAYLRRCTPGLTPEERALLRRPQPEASGDGQGADWSSADRWTTSDVPVLDALICRIGDPQVQARRRRAARQSADRRRAMDSVVAELVAADDSDLHLMGTLRTGDLRDRLDEDSDQDPDASPAGGDRWAGTFAHVVVDEAQELTDAEWRMIVDRCPSGSITVVGDRAQSRTGFGESWAELSEAVVPTSIPPGGEPVRYGAPEQLPEVIDAWLDEHAEGEGAGVVIRALGAADSPDVTDDLIPDRARDRVTVLDPVRAKGLEFDLVVLLEPKRFGAGEPPVAGAVDRYVAMTRATGRLVVLSDR